MQTGPGNHQSLVRLTQDLKGRWLHCLPPKQKNKKTKNRRSSTCWFWSESNFPVHVPAEGTLTSCFGRLQNVEKGC